jgi:hypothetical protein
VPACVFDYRLAPIDETFLPLFEHIRCSPHAVPTADARILVDDHSHDVLFGLRFCELAVRSERTWSPDGPGPAVHHDHHAHRLGDFGLGRPLPGRPARVRRTATSPAASAGTVDVTVTTLGGTSAATASDQFTYG